jgi:mannitol-1-phosphate 5-dehydrogenase
VGPAAELAERGLAVDGLLAAFGAALRFDVPTDPESVELQQLLRSRDASTFVDDVTGIAMGHPLAASLVGVVAARQAGD